MEESLKNIIIVTLTFVLLYLILNKFRKSYYSYPTKPKKNNIVYLDNREKLKKCQQQVIIKLNKQTNYDNKKKCHLTNKYTQDNNNYINKHKHHQLKKIIDSKINKDHKIYQRKQVFNDPNTIYNQKCIQFNDQKLTSINSNGLTNDIVLSNMFDNELVHINHSKPFVSNVDEPIVNNPETNAKELVVEKFNYNKDFDETKFNYFDPTGEYNL